ncbi:MAG: hypothetical protein GC164_04405 [Phycisphaera sp.]|nr:hypothetical protein [Phycisphaera sp.]
MLTHPIPTPPIPANRIGLILLALFINLTATHTAPAQADRTMPSEKTPLDINALPTLTLHDDARDKDIPLRVTYPTLGDHLPVIIWCHGALGSKDGYQPLIKPWAQAGFIVIQPTFGDSVSLMTPEERRKHGSLVNMVNSPQVLGEWDDRPKDVKCVLDNLDRVVSQIDGLKDRADLSRIGVGGHSFGAHTTMLIAGMTLNVLRQSISYPDDRPTAFMAISPNGTTRSLNKESFSHFGSKPLLFVTGDHDGSPIKGQENKTGTWRREAFDLAPQGPISLLWVNDAHHNFGGITGPAPWPGAGPRNNDQLQCVIDLTTAFWQAQLKNDDQAKKALTPESVKAKYPQTAHIENKQ